MVTSASGPPQETILLKNIDSKMIQKKFQSINESISASLSPTGWRNFYLCLRAKSVRVFISKS
jgi:hypothetical protein